MRSMFISTLFVLAALSSFAAAGPLVDPTTTAAVAAPFLRPLDGQLDAQFSAIRQRDCAGYRTVLREVQYRFQHRTPETIRAAEGNVAGAAAVESVERAVKRGDMSPACLVWAFDSVIGEDGVAVLLTPEGDVAIGYSLPDDDGRGGTAFTPWREVRPEGMVYDTITPDEWVSEIAIDPVGNHCVGDPEFDSIWPECKQ